MVNNNLKSRSLDKNEQIKASIDMGNLQQEISSR